MAGLFEARLYKVKALEKLRQNIWQKAKKQLSMLLYVHMCDCEIGSYRI